MLRSRGCLIFLVVGVTAAALLLAQAGQPKTGLTSELDTYLAARGSPLAGHGADIVAISGAASNFGKDVCAAYNAWQWFYKDTARCAANAFDSWEAGIDRVTKGLASIYLQQGNDTIDKIAEKYTGSTQRKTWTSTVSAIYASDLKGDPANLAFKAADLNAQTSSAADGLDGFGMGSSTHLRVGKDRLQPEFDQQHAGGVQWIREEVPWSEVEEPKGQFRWNYAFKNVAGQDVSRDFDLLIDQARQRSLNVVLVLGYGSLHYDAASSPDNFVTAWRNYVQAVVNRYGDRVDYWEIGNEENSRGFWGKFIYPGKNLPAEPDPALYARLLQAAHDVIKARDPNDIVVLGGLAGYAFDLNDCDTNYFNYLQRLNDVGAWGAFDIIAVHPYRDQGDAPEAVIDRGQTCVTGIGTRYNLAGEIRALRDWTRNLGAKPIWITELGWNQNVLEQRAQERGVAAATVEADYLIRSYVSLLAESDVTNVFWYTWTDVPDDAVWALDNEGRSALQVTSGLLRGAQSSEHVRGSGDGDDVYEYRFKNDRRTIIVLWKATGGDTPRTVSVSNLPDGVLRKIDSREVGLMGQVLTPVNGQVNLDLTERPIFLVVDPLETPPGSDLWEQIVAWFNREIISRLEDLWQKLKDGLQQAIQDILNWLKNTIESLIKGLLAQLRQICGTACIGPMLVLGWGWQRSRRWRARIDARRRATTRISKDDPDGSKMEQP